MILTHFGTAFKSELCGVGLFLTAFCTALTGGPSIFTVASHSSATLASRFLERRRGLRFNKFTVRVREKQPHKPHSHPRKYSHHKHNRKLNKHTKRKIQRSPDTLQFRIGHDLENNTIQTMHTDSFTASRPLFPTYTFFFPRFPLFFFTRHTLPQPTAEKAFFVHRSVFPELASVFSGQGSSVFQHSLFGDVHQLFFSP